MPESLVSVPPERASTRVVSLIVASAMFMEQLDGTVLATALPAMAKSFDADPLHMNVALTSYLLTLAMFIPASGRLADRFGSRTVFRAAIGLFTLGSIACAQAPTLASLEGIEITVGTQIRLLHHILGVSRVAREPAREVERRVEMRERQQLETSLPVVFGQGPRPDCGCRVVYRRGTQIIPGYSATATRGLAARSRCPLTSAPAARSRRRLTTGAASDIAATTRNATEKSGSIAC